MLFVVRMAVSCNCLESDFGNKIGNEHLKADFILSHIYEFFPSNGFVDVSVVC